MKPPAAPTAHPAILAVVVASRRPGCRLTLMLLLATLMAGCASYAYRPARSVERESFRRPAKIVQPANNPGTPAKVALGERLFLDPRLSGGGAMACATCHDPARDFQDGRAVPLRSLATVAGEPRFRTPTLWNVSEQKRLFWDGRAHSLEQQAAMPVENPLEMNSSLPEALARVAADADYRHAFAAAFPAEPHVTPRNFGHALAAYQRTLQSPEAPFDRWVEGDDAALTPAALRGFALFTGKANCIECHTGWAQTDGRRHDIGLPPGPHDARRPIFKTPTLRELTGRAPYMHDGRFATLEEVIIHYADGVVDRVGTPDRVDLDASERDDLLAFLRALDSRDTPSR